MFRNLEKIADCGFSVYIESHRYGNVILAGIDFPLQSLEKYDYYGRESLRDYIDDSNSPGDIDAIEAYNKLCEFADNNEAFLFAHEKTIEKCLEILDKRAASWLALNFEQQEQLLNNFIESQKHH